MGNSTFVVRGRRQARSRTLAVIALMSLIGALLVALTPAARAEAASPCGASVNVIVCENRNAGTSPDEWDIDGAGDPTIQGFATDISVNAGQRIDFKVDTDAADYDIDIYRTGWYQGLGARKVDSVSPSAPLPQRQPECLSDLATELYDCGTWHVSASWNVPATAVSGVYVAKLTRSDTGGASHIIFIVRRDGNTSDVVFQTSDPTWQAYNSYGGSDFYQGAANGRAYKISYNRPFATRGGVEHRDFYFSSEYATVRFLERNGYDMSYIAGVDTDRRGGELRNHRVFLSVGHDEYWSGAQRANIEAARDAGVNLQFLTGNEGYWRTRYEDSTTGTAGDKRTLVSYKETWGNEAHQGGGKIDPSVEWTGTWRDPRFADAAQGGHSPENALTGTMYMVNHVDLPVTVSSGEGKTRLWRHTALAQLPAGASAALARSTVGYESNEDIDNGMRPHGLIRLSTTRGPTEQYLRDYGNVVTAGSTEHHVTLYRAPSGALVFSSASVQWGWGLDETHDGDGAAADPRIQQAEVNLLADMGARPGSLQSGLVAATASTDTAAPTTVITAPTAGATIAHGSTVTVTGTATDVGGVVAGVEVSTDEGRTWHPAQGTTSWTYSYVQQGVGQARILARAIDDSANFSAAGASRTVAVTGPYTVFGSEVPAVASATDTDPVELGLRFTPTGDGFVTGVRFYKGPANSGTHVGSLWDPAGVRLSQVTFGPETSEGWQTATFPAAVPVVAGQTYTVSYTASAGGYAMQARYWPYEASATSPLEVSAAVGTAAAGVYGTAGSFPTDTWQESNYFVDPVFSAADSSPLRIVAQSPKPGVSSVATDSAVTATFSRAADPATVSLRVTAADGTEAEGTVSYDAATRTARFAPSARLQPATTYRVTPAAADADGVGLAEDSGWTFTTQADDRAEGDCPCTLFSESRVPAVPSVSETALVTLGVSFTPDAAGRITALRFYKGAGNAGPHTGALWDSAGRRLADVTFGDESTAGWQTATLETAVTVTAGQRYVASYLAPRGGYSVTAGAFTTPYTRGPLTVAASGAVYTYADAFPDSSSTTDYGIDVVFEREAQSPAVVSVSPESGTTAAASAVATVTFDRAVAAGYHGTVTADGAAVDGAWSTSADRTAVSFEPVEAYPAGALVVVALTGVTSTDGAAAPEVSWSFRVAGGTAPVTLLGDRRPAVQQRADTAPVELGMAFRSAVDGRVSALRFYKVDGDPGTHVGSLWDADGARLAQVTFQGESASGWQRMALSQPVTIVAGRTYTVSYHSDRGHYAYTSGGFASPVTSGPLTALSPDNGRYRYGSGGVAPTGVWNATNYFVDVEFRVAEAAAEVTETSPAAGAVGVPADAEVSATLDRDPAEAGATLAVTGPDGVVAGTLATDAAARTLTFRPAAPLAPSATYTGTVAVDGLTLSTWTFRVAEPAVDGPRETIFGSATPEVASVTEGSAVEVGTAFTVARPGTVTAVRFYRGPDNAGPHRAILWGPGGAEITRVDFPEASGTGWQRAPLSAPVTLQPGVTYVVSYLASHGGFSATPNFFATPRVSGDLTAPAAGNGRYHYGSNGGYPVDSWASTGYFVDVEVAFAASGTPGPAASPTPTPTPTATPSPAPSPTATPSPEPSVSPAPEPEPSASPTSEPEPPDAPPAATAQAPAAGAIEVAPTTTVSAVLQPAPAAASIAVTGPNGAVAGESGYDAGTGTVTFTPAEPLAWSSDHTATVSTPGGEVTAATWSFRTIAAPEVVDVRTIFGDATPQHPWWDESTPVLVATRFTVDTAGHATGVRFYKGAANTGSHTGSLWTSAGERLGEVSFVDETADGWQTARFATPIALQPGVEYRVGLFSTSGRFAVDLGGLAAQTRIGPFTIPAGGGAYTYGQGYPADLSNHNYWVDITFDGAG